MENEIKKIVGDKTVYDKSAENAQNCFVMKHSFWYFKAMLEIENEIECGYAKLLRNGNHFIMKNAGTGNNISFCFVTENDEEIENPDINWVVDQFMYVVKLWETEKMHLRGIM